MWSVKCISFIAIISYIEVPTFAQNLSKGGNTIRQKFSLTSNELKQKCNQKEQTLFTNITSTLENLRNIREDIIEKYIEGTKGAPANGDWNSVILMSRLCETNPDVISVLTKLAEAVQLCLHEKERMNDKEKINVLRNMMLSVCLTLDFEKVMRTNRNCMQDPRGLLAEDKCVKQFPNFKTIYDLEPIPLEHTSEKCDEFSKVWNCEINAANICEVSTKNSIREFISTMKEFILC